MLKTEVKKPLDTFDREASETFENMVHAQLKVYKKQGMLREALAALIDIAQHELIGIDDELYGKQILHPRALEQILRGIGMAIENPQDLRYVFRNTEGGVACLKNWTRMEERVKSRPPGLPGCYFQNWFAADTGNRQTVQEFAEEMKHSRNRISDSARLHLEHHYTADKQLGTNYLAAMMPAQIGLDTGGDFGLIKSQALEYGLLPCACEDAMYVMLHYNRYGHDCPVLVFSAVSHLGRLLCMVWDEDDECWVLRSCSQSHTFSARTRFIFRKKWNGEEERDEEGEQDEE